MAATGYTSFREVLQKQGFPLRWKEIALSRGGRSGQDVKVAEHCGGYAYRDSGRLDSPARNRFIYWRANQDVLELIETSLDFNLRGNCVKFRFQGAAIVKGISIHESHGDVVILVPTVCAVHRIVLPHPNKLHKFGLEYAASSIFAEASINHLQDPSNCHLISSDHVTYSVHTAAAWLTHEGEAVFAMATNMATILLVKLPAHGIQGIVTQFELKQSSVMQRLWTGLVPSVIRGDSVSGDTSLSLCIHPVRNDLYVYSLCRDHKLRMWSCKTLECVMAVDMLAYLPDNIDPHKVAIGGEGHIVKTALGSTSQSLCLGVFLCLSDRCQLCVFEAVFEEGHHQLRHLTTVFGRQEDLVDFCITDKHIWSLWTTTDGNSVARFASLSSESSSQDWCPIILHPAETRDITVPDHREPRETFMELIFYPAKFSTETIVKSLNIYKRSLDTTQLPDTNIPIQALKTEVLTVVEHEIQTTASQYEMAEETYYQLQLDQWSKFYSCCTQYQQRENKPLGIFADSNTGLVGIVKKGCLGLLRPCHLLEHLYLTPTESCQPEHLTALASLRDEEELCGDVIKLCAALQDVKQCVTEDIAYCFEQDLYHTQNPLEVAHSIVNNILHTGCEELESIQQRTESIHDIIRAVEALLSLLSTDANSDFGPMEDSVVDASRKLSVGHLFSSNAAIELVCGSLQQYIETRLAVSRELLLLLLLVRQFGEKVGIKFQTSERIRSELIGQTCQVVQANFLLRWATQMVASPTPTSALEANMRQLEALDLSDAVAAIPLFKSEQHWTLLEMFLQGTGGQKVKDMLVQNDLLTSDVGMELWCQTMMTTMNCVVQLLWPVNSGTFPEFLMFHCQYQELQEYVRLTRDWCESNAAVCNFLLGQSYLHCNEPVKALDCFLEAASGLPTEQFLMRLLQTGAVDSQSTEVIYYLKVIRLFEQFHLSDLAVTLAKTAIDTASEEDPNRATLWSKVFKHQLELGHNEEAYSAMINNPDASRRKDCLRQLLVILCERGQLQTLVELPYKDRYVDLEDEVVFILESRARSIDLMKHSYYDLLYSFHVFRSNYRKAGSVMYEYGMRLGCEVAGLKGLQKQAKCYLASMNSLRLVDPKYAWIVKPVAATAENEDMSMTAPKHNLDGEELQIPLKRQVEVVELESIEKEYTLVHARLQLLKRQPDPTHMTGPTPSADETIGLLVNAGLFDSAINICRLFDMPMDAVFEGLASRCVKLAENSSNHMMGDNDYTAEAWDWLQQNELRPTNAIKEGSTSAEPAWGLLHYYLEKYEEKFGRYHKCVASRVLSHGFQLPSWFTARYKKLNGAELLRLYLNYGMLEEAAYLTMEYIGAVQGKGKEYFGLSTYLCYTSPSVWLPYTSIDQLLLALNKASATDEVYSELYKELQFAVNHYMEEVESVSHDVVTAGVGGHRMPQDNF